MGPLPWEMAARKVFLFWKRVIGIVDEIEENEIRVGIELIEIFKENKHLEFEESLRSCGLSYKF